MPITDAVSLLNTWSQVWAWSQVQLNRRVGDEESSRRAGTKGRGFMSCRAGKPVTNTRLGGKSGRGESLRRQSRIRDPESGPVIGMSRGLLVLILRTQGNCGQIWRTGWGDIRQHRVVCDDEQQTHEIRLVRI